MRVNADALRVTRRRQSLLPVASVTSEREKERGSVRERHPRDNTR